MIKHSHNSYWNKLPIHDALNNQCTMVEFDLIYSFKRMLVNHVWLPFHFLTYGSLEQWLNQYLVILNSINLQNKKYYFYIEIKTGNMDVVSNLCDLLLPYVINNKFTIVLRVAEHSFIGKLTGRTKVMNAIKDMLPQVVLYDDLLKQEEIITIDLFKKHWYQQFCKRFWK